MLRLLLLRRELLHDLLQLLALHLSLSCRHFLQRLRLRLRPLLGRVQLAPEAVLVLLPAPALLLHAGVILLIVTLELVLQRVQLLTAARTAPTAGSLSVASSADTRCCLRRLRLLQLAGGRLCRRCGRCQRVGQQVDAMLRLVQPALRLGRLLAARLPVSWPRTARAASG